MKNNLFLLREVEIKYYLTIAVTGFLLTLFYLGMTDFNFKKYSKNISANLNKSDLLLLSGCEEKKNSVFLSKEKISSFAIYLPADNTYQLKLDLDIKNYKKEDSDLILELYINNKYLGVFTNRSSFRLILPSNWIHKGFNKIGFINQSKKILPVVYKNISVSNYSNKVFMFPAGYILFDKYRWSLPRPFTLKTIIFAIFASINLTLIWFLYSLCIYPLTTKSFSDFLKLDIFSYVLPLLTLASIFLFSRLFMYNLVFSPFQLFIFIMVLTMMTKFFILYRYINKKLIKEKIKSSKSDIRDFQILLRYFSLLAMNLMKTFFYPLLIRNFKNGNLFIFIFFILIFTSGIMLSHNDFRDTAKIFSNYAFLFLISGIIIKIIYFKRNSGE